MTRFKVHALVKSKLTFCEKLREINIDYVRIWVDKSFLSEIPYPTQTPLEKDIPIARVRFLDKEGLEHQGLVPLNVEVFVDAKDENMAQTLGLDRINHHLDILTFITGYSIHFATNCTVTEENGDAGNFRNMRLCMGWIKPAPQNAELCLKNVLFIMSRTASIQQNKISKSMRYFRKAMGEDDHDIQFLFLWVALECLGQLEKVQKYPVCRACNTEIRVCMHCNADTIYNPQESALIKRLLVDETQLLSKSEFDKLNKIRSKLVHSGLETSQDSRNLTWGVKKLISVVPNTIEKVIDQVNSCK